ncbi:NAD(P)-dependent oxidoreductase [Streptomyces litchfieldiae]|uniref:NAD(P)-dependent oxidoreductase n=1 Tax=Streptomyces litchfieldiae TaxID=3075543 RepID=A0ABU2MKC1_9ACTN|nr:NAD(P)-dependent oxidoreductase [Streptomyces sp. DSM 44938]MDT0342047.1 NAD(P)-dependent oxidoreductase [Streptomyces sp. DSM 44938]
MASVAVLGLGAMGTALAGAFLTAGHDVTVWNRTAARAEPLAARGARVAATPEEAVTAAPLTVICVVDDTAARQVLDPLATTLAGRTLVNLTNGTPEQGRELAAWAEKHGIAFLDGAVMVPVPVVGTPDALILTSGPPKTFEAHRDTLAALGGKVRHLGTDPGLAAAHDLAMLDAFFTGAAGLVHAFALAGAEGISPEDFLSYATEVATLLPAIAAGFASAIGTGEHLGAAGNLRMDAAAIRHIAEVSRAHGLDTSALDSVLALVDRTVAAGHGEDSFSSVIELIRPPAPSAAPADRPD